jgi:hypothetical protein
MQLLARLWGSYLKSKKGETYIMAKGSKKLKLTSDKSLLIAWASVVTATASLLKVIFDFIIQLISLSH